MFLQVKAVQMNSEIEDPGISAKHCTISTAKGVPLSMPKLNERHSISNVLCNSYQINQPFVA